MKDPEYTNHVTVCWGAGSDTLDYWDQICIWAIEHFGMPGDRYITDISAQSMTWSFASDKDALLFRLRFGEVAQ